MADKKSCEGKVTTLECIECGYREVFTERQFKFTDGFRCNICNGFVNDAVTKPGERINNRRTNKQNNELGETIKYLKAIQREARKATADLMELNKHMICGIDYGTEEDMTVVFRPEISD